MKMTRIMEIVCSLFIAAWFVSGCAFFKSSATAPPQSVSSTDDMLQAEEPGPQEHSGALTPVDVETAQNVPHYAFQGISRTKPQPRLMSQTVPLKTPQLVGDDEDFEEPEVAFDVPVETNQSVLSFIKYFQGPKRNWMINSLKRGGRYLPKMQSIFREEGLPEDLVYLALIESGFNPYACSRAGAVGIWQFIPSTGVRYGLRITPWLDERRDPEKSTRAAARYLKDLYAQFGDWYLAAAAYNCGEKNVEYALQRYSIDNYWHLTELPGFPTETKEYVPKYLAAMMIAKEPHKYGLGRIEMDDPPNYHLVELPKPTHIKAVAQVCDTEPEVLLTLNPELKRACIPEAGYRLKVPAGVDYSLLKDLPALEPDRPQNVFRTHRVTRGETLSSIARRYGTNVESIRRANKLARSYRLREKEILVIPVASGKARESLPEATRVGYATKASGPSPSLKDAPQVAKASPIIHEVKKGETLFGISKTYGVDVNAVKTWNPHLASLRLQPGQKLTLWVDAAPTTTGPSLGKGQGAGSPSTSGAGKQPIIHTVRARETLWSIAKRYQVALDDLLAWNNLSARTSLRVGDQLKVYVPLQANAKRNESRRTALKD